MLILFRNDFLDVLSIRSLISPVAVPSCKSVCISIVTDRLLVKQFLLEFDYIYIWWWKNITAVIVFVSLLIVIFIAWLSGGKQARKNADSEIAELKAQLQKQDARIQQLIETPIVVSPASPKIDLDIIYSQINDIGELATIEYLFTDAAEFRDSKQI